MPDSEEYVADELGWVKRTPKPKLRPLGEVGTLNLQVYSRTTHNPNEGRIAPTIYKSAASAREAFRRPLRNGWSNRGTIPGFGADSRMVTLSERPRNAGPITHFRWTEMDVLHKNMVIRAIAMSIASVHRRCGPCTTVAYGRSSTPEDARGLRPVRGYGSDALSGVEARP